MAFFSSDNYKLLVSEFAAVVYEPHLHVPIITFVKRPIQGWSTNYEEWFALSSSLRHFINIQLGLIHLTVTNGTQSNNNLHGTEIPDGQPVQVVQL